MSIKKPNPDGSASAQRELEPSDSSQPRQRLPASADHRRSVSVAGDPVIPGVNEAGMLFQSQDIDVRAAELRVCERALRKVVGGCRLPMNQSGAPARIFLTAAPPQLSASV